MPEFIRWEPMTCQEGWHGFLGEVRVFALIPWGGENEKWPWQLQNLRSELIPQEPVQAARTSDEAKHLAEMGAAIFLTRAHLIPATDEQLDTVIPLYRNRETEQDRIRWLRETGWHEHFELTADETSVTITTEEANRRLAIAKMVVAEIAAAEAIDGHMLYDGRWKSDPIVDIASYLQS